MTYDANDEYRWAEAQDARKATQVKSPDNVLTVRFKRLHPAAIAPTYAHAGDAGADLVALEDTIIEPGDTVKVRTGIAIELPDGYEMQTRPRSGVTLKTKLRVQLGTIDANYRGEIGVIVDNIAPNGMGIDYYSHYGCDFEWGGYRIKKGMRIAQAVIAPVSRAHFVEATGELGESERGAGGFGSSGVSAE